MAISLPLRGVRVHLSGSIPESSSDKQSSGISAFVQLLTSTILREGGSIIHGSHPTLSKSLEDSVRPFVQGGGRKDALTLVCAKKFAETLEQKEIIEKQREYSLVQIIPSVEGNISESLIPMREWMAERSDVIVCVGGKWWDSNKPQAGVPAELDRMLDSGKTGFVVAGFGGAIEGYINDDPTVLARLQNGLSESKNKDIANDKSIKSLVNKIVSQLKLLPRTQKSITTGRNFRILVLDGGGLRGTFTAAVLAKWDDMLKSGGGSDLIKHFDLVAGTSTGAILAIGLGLGLKPSEILAFYRKQGGKIFPKDRKVRHWIRSKHDSMTLRGVLEETLGYGKLSDESCCRLIIPTVRAIHGEAEVIVTAHSKDRTAFREIKAVDAALASSAAPTYFDEAVLETNIATESYIDGGIWANNPIIPAIAEAVRYLNIPLDRIDVLSIGTMGHEADFSKKLGKGKALWAEPVTNLFFTAQEHGAIAMADSFLGPARHLRINQKTPSEIKLDDIEAIEDMTSRGSCVGKDNFAEVRSRFLDGIHVPDWREYLE